MKADTERKIYKVSQITSLIKTKLEGSFTGIWVEGEISNFKTQLSGHAYFTLKDQLSQISAVLWRSTLERSKFRLEDGQKVLLFGRITVYGPRGQYQLVTDKIEPLGIGALAVAFQQLKKKLSNEGLFDLEHKQPIPYLPEKLGIVTSATGAAIRDICNVVNRRFSNVEIYIYPVRVQGKEAKYEIAQAIEDCNKQGDLDVVLITRGGGSLEDLWPFNEEIVARAIYNSRIPLMSAVGHEIDWTISDFVADSRAPTPSAAAELLFPKKQELTDKITMLTERLTQNLLHYICMCEETLRRLSESYIMKQPMRLIDESAQTLDTIASELTEAFKKHIKNKEYLLRERVASLEALSPLSVLSRGYSITFKNKDKRHLTQAADVRPGEVIHTRLSRGSLVSRIEEVNDE